MPTDRNPFMATRRTFLQCGMGACAAGAMSRPVVSYYKAVFDERFDEPRVFAAGAAARGTATVPIQGDISKLFFEDLDLRWRQGPVSLIGFTTPAALFCLDLLARDRGMRLSHRVTNPRTEAVLGVLDGLLPRRSLAPSGDPSGLVFWIIAPRAHAAAKETGNA